MSGVVDVVLVDACLRDGAGGSPTAVVPDGEGLTDSALMRIPALTGTSHVAVLGGRGVRFFTGAGELPACGHGTVAAIAVLAAGSGGAGFEGRLVAGGRDFVASGVCGDGVVEAWFDQGLVAHRAADDEVVGPFLDALGLRHLDAGDEPSVASPGRPRLLLPAADREVLAGLRPDQERLASLSRQHGLLGCFVYTPLSALRRPAARMFAPAIGVPEDVANANSTGCLAAHQVAVGGEPAVAVDQGDALGRPSTVYATAARTAAGVTTRVGGTARIVRTRWHVSGI